MSSKSWSSTNFWGQVSEWTEKTSMNLYFPQISPRSQSIIDFVCIHILDRPPFVCVCVGRQQRQDKQQTVEDKKEQLEKDNHEEKSIWIGLESIVFFLFWFTSESHLEHAAHIKRPSVAVAS